jgi:DNA invertase Pin-like site-specific DNA recombinase
MLIGYGRVSTHDQNLDLQRDALEAAGCERVIVDRMSGAASARPGLVQLKDVLRGGDTLVVWRLDRLGRSLKDLIAWVGYLDAQEIGLRSLHEAIDTTTPTGKLTFHIFGALAEFERTLIRDRTQAGLAAARARGRTGGRRLEAHPLQLRPRSQRHHRRPNSQIAAPITCQIAMPVTGNRPPDGAAHRLRGRIA